MEEPASRRLLAIFLHLLLNAVVPLTLGGGWRGPADVIGRVAGSALKGHATFIAVFLVVAHIAMILGMLDPKVLGYQVAHQHQPDRTTRDSCWPRW